MASQFVFDAIGTKWIIDVYDPLSRTEEEKLLARIHERITEFDKTYSRFRDDSLVMEMSRKPGRYVLPEDAQELFSVYKKVYDLTGGRFTPLIGNALVDAGYDAAYTLKQKQELTKPLSWDEVVSYSHPHIDILKPAILDFGAAGKGYLIDIVAGIIAEHGVVSYCVDAGGDIVQKNAQEAALTVGLEHPEDQRKIIGTVPLLNKSLCGSAGNRRVWGDFHHIINPDTLQSPRHMLAVWAIADKTIIADAMTTALYFVQPDVLAKHFSFEYFILNPDYSFEQSPGFGATVFT